MTKSEMNKLIKDFKPEFGNENHIRAMAVIKKVRERDELEKKKDRIIDEYLELDEALKLEAEQLRFLITGK